MTAPAKEIAGLGQPLSFESNYLIRGGGKELRRLRWSFPPCPEIRRVDVKSFGYQQLFGFGLSQYFSINFKSLIVFIKMVYVSR